MADTAAQALPASEPPPPGSEPASPGPAPSPASAPSPAPAKAATFRDVFADGEFRAIWLAEFASIAGDQFARVALTVIVFERTGSPLLTALTYATTYLPWLVGGLFLSDVADRFPRRNVMITADLSRMLLVGAMAIPGMPLWAMVLLLFVVASLNAPFQGARSALRAAIMPDDRYALGLAASQVTRELGVVGGFVAGGVIVSVLGARPALLIDAGTFLVSALLLTLAVRHRPATAGRRRQSRLAEMTAGLRLVFANQRLRALMLLGWLCAFYTVPEALAVPYAAKLHHGSAAAGLIFAAGPLGSAVGMLIFTRLVRPARRLRWMGPMAVAASLTLAICLARPNLILLLAIVTASGLLAAYQIAANAAFVLAAPDDRRGQAYAIANGGMNLGQGLLYVLAGAAASAATPATVVAGSGLLGAALAMWLVFRWRPEPSVAPERSVSG
ncbi:MAG: MFS transporter [Actinobacteria bacterium]|nr:MFS transporter [Actinomycetota bacterium]